MIYLLCFSQLPWIIPNTNACTFLSKLEKLFYRDILKNVLPKYSTIWFLKVCITYVYFLLVIKATAFGMNYELYTHIQNDESNLR